MSQKGKYWDIFVLNKKIIDIGCFFLSIKRMPQYIAASKERAKNRNIKLVRKNDKCYICGLGPSLKEVDFNRIDADIIVVNRFYKFAEQNNINISPTYYCLIDDAFYKDLSGEAQKAFSRYPNSAFLLNGKYKDYIKEETRKLGNAFYAFMWKGALNKRTRIDFTRRIPIANNVVNTAIALAIYAGYKEIILLGCDFNSFASPKSIHCYHEENDERIFSLGFELFCYSFVAEDHMEIDAYAKRNGIKIYNATQGSLIDAYEKIDMELIY